VPTVDWNRRTWGEEHRWAEEGDEWSGMAAACGQPYESWKSALIEALLLPYVNGDSVAVEIAPGHGRWAETLVQVARSITLVDLNPDCLEACRQRFAGRKNVGYHLNGGRTLPNEASSVDFVWSFDSFVHMELDVISQYLCEISRVLRRGGIAVLHHADKRPVPERLRDVAGRMGSPGTAALRLAQQGRLRDTGNRSEVSAAQVAAAAEAAGLRVLLQLDRWGPGGRYTVAKYHDAMSVISKP